MENSPDHLELLVVARPVDHDGPSIRDEAANSRMCLPPPLGQTFSAAFGERAAPVHARDIQAERSLEVSMGFRKGRHHEMPPTHRRSGPCPQGCPDGSLASEDDASQVFATKANVPNKRTLITPAGEASVFGDGSGGYKCLAVPLRG